MEIPGLGLGEASEPSTGVPKMELGRTDLQSVVLRARGNARKRQTGPPRICGAFQWYFTWQRANLRLRKLDGEALRRTELVDLTKI